jgi:hypothetical protein
LPARLRDATVRAIGRLQGKFAMSTLLFVTAFCIVALLVYMARYSGRLRVTHTRVIDAPLAEAYARVIDLRHWRDWNPWLEHEQDAAVVYSAKTDAAGSFCTWSQAGVGVGTIEHLRIVEPGRIEQRLRLRQPFPLRGLGSWQFTDLGGKTRATWSLRGRVAFPMRAFAETVQGAIALEFRYGLDRLAGLVEGADAPRYTLAYPGLRQMAAVRYAYVSHRGGLAGLAEAMRGAMVELRAKLASRSVAATGEPIAVYVKTHIRQRTTECHFGIPVGAAEVEGLAVASLPAHRSFVARLQGSQAHLEVAWYLAMRHMRAAGIEPDLRITPFERYLNDPDTARGNDNLTELHIAARQAT